MVACHSITELSKSFSAPYQTGFEGPEKLLEIWWAFDGEAGSPTRNLGLRKYERKIWKEMLRLVGCEIISVISNSEMDAYLLSESSMFVYRDRVIIKTCGTTTLLLCLDFLLNLARNTPDINGNSVKFISYSRRAFMFPTEQQFPHNSWEKEVEWLDRYFNGSAYSIGRNKNDNWHCYVFDNENLGDNHLVSRLVMDRSDQTLEILMCGLDEVKSQRFVKKKALTKDGNIIATDELKKLYPSAIFDDHIFEPWGYSCNALSESGYLTVHVTPEPHCSYASFETNILFAQEQVSREIIKLFSPSRFIITHFVQNFDEQPGVISNFDSFFCPDYALDEKVLYKFGIYTLIYLHFVANQQKDVVIR